ncbi:MAG: hypothetical protein PVG93_06585 [Phycisphaerales bacterium]
MVLRVDGSRVVLFSSAYPAVSTRSARDCKKEAAKGRLGYSYNDNGVFAAY